MALSGPRLDRPSAIGDEGRPRTISLWIATASIFSVIVLTGYLESTGTQLGSLATTAGLTVAGVALLARESFVKQVVGTLLVLGVGSIFTAIALVTPVVGVLAPAADHWFIFVTSGFAIALLGIGLAWADAGDQPSLRRATASIGFSYVFEVISLCIILILLTILFIGIVFILSLTETQNPVVSTSLFLILLGLAAGLLALGLHLFPLRRLLSRSAESVYGPRIDRSKLVLGIVVAASFVLLLLIVPVLSAVQTPPAVATALGVLSSRFVIWPIVGCGLIGLLMAATALCLRLFTRQFTTKGKRRLAVSVAGCCFSILLTFTLITSLLWWLFLAATPFLAIAWILLMGFITPLLPLFLFGSLTLGMRTGLLPTKAGGPAIAAIGMVVATIGLSRYTPLLAFSAAASAILVWILSTYGLGLTAELGHRPETKRLELVCGIVTVTIAALAVITVYALDLVRTTAFISVQSTTALALVAIGVLFLSIPVRG